MSIVFDKHSLISKLALPRTSLRQANVIAKRHHADAVITIGLINNMPDPAIRRTERQFKEVLRAAAGDFIVDLRYFSLPSVRRSQALQSRNQEFYTGIFELNRLKLDGLIVTGAEPQAPHLIDEPYWQELIRLIQWANANTRSTIWSCLAAHAAVLHLDGIERRRLGEKCSGVVECFKTTDDWLTRDLPSPFKVPHSRLNALDGSNLKARGYRVLTESSDVGVDIFVKQLRSHFVFFQGHPEYDASSLSREYRRDISRFLLGERATFPVMPSGYFVDETARELKCFQSRASRARNPTLIRELPTLTVRQDIQVGVAAKIIFRNWLRYLADR